MVWQSKEGYALQQFNSSNYCNIFAYVCVTFNKVKAALTILSMQKIENGVATQATQVLGYWVQVHWMYV